MQLRGIADVVPGCLQAGSSARNAQLMAEAGCLERWGHASAVWHATPGDIAASPSSSSNIAVNSKVVLVGGYGGPGAHARRSDVLLYCSMARRWSLLRACSGVGRDGPIARMGHSLVCIGRKDGRSAAMPATMRPC